MLWTPSMYPPLVECVQPMSTPRPSWVAEVLVTEKALLAQIQVMAKQIANDYRDKVSVDSPLLLVCVLRGAFLFMADLCRALADHGLPVQCDFVMVSSYHGGTKSSGHVKMLLDVRSSTVENRHILLVEDIVDTARTLDFLRKHFGVRRSASVKMVTLLDKKGAREIPLAVDYVCFDIPNKFVVGYGLDYNQNLREVRDIVSFNEAAYLKLIAASKNKL